MAPTNCPKVKYLRVPTHRSKTKSGETETREKPTVSPDFEVWRLFQKLLIKLFNTGKSLQLRSFLKSFGEKRNRPLKQSLPPCNQQAHDSKGTTYALKQRSQNYSPHSKREENHSPHSKRKENHSPHSKRKENHSPHSKRKGLPKEYESIIDHLRGALQEVTALKCGKPLVRQKTRNDIEIERRDIEWLQKLKASKISDEAVSRALTASKRSSQDITLKLAEVSFWLRSMRCDVRKSCKPLERVRESLVLSTRRE